MPASKAYSVILVALIILAGIGVYHLVRNQTLADKLEARATSALDEVFSVESTLSAAPVATNDSNWAGYIVATDHQNPQPVTTGISAEWTVPEVSPSSQNDTFSAVWIGIGGLFSGDGTLIQVGSEQDSIAGVSDYFFWYELLPDTSNTIDTIVVSPGDRITASIQLVDPAFDGWSIYIADLTSNQEFQIDVTYFSSQLSAEWIVERPTAGRRLATLADIGSVTFTNCQATINSRNGSISAFPSFESIMYLRVANTNGTGEMQLTTVSDLTNGGQSFTVNTYPDLIPELIAWVILPLIVGTLVLAIVERRHAKNVKHIIFGSSF
jgi:hypothetical protein